jgi:hypothetical protein
MIVFDSYKTDKLIDFVGYRTATTSPYIADLLAYYHDLLSPSPHRNLGRQFTADQRENATPCTTLRWERFEEMEFDFKSADALNASMARNDNAITLFKYRPSADSYEKTAYIRGLIPSRILIVAVNAPTAIAMAAEVSAHARRLAHNAMRNLVTAAADAIIVTLMMNNDLLVDHEHYMINKDQYCHQRLSRTPWIPADPIMTRQEHVHRL